MKRYLSLFLIFSACTVQKPIVSSITENNKTYTVEYLFEHDGCKVYRFFDLGHYIYFTNCNGETINKGDSTQIRNTIKVEKK